MIWTKQDDFVTIDKSYGICMNEKKLKKIALLPNVITAFGLSCGLFVIFKMNMTGIGEVSGEI